jgi:prepilin-type N-terminal cleavage/methylation domain-containing protein
MTAASTSSADRRARGVTLVELIVTMAVMGVIMAATVPLFTLTQRGYTSLEVGTVVPAAMQEALGKIQNRLVETRRVFDGSSDYSSRLPTLSPAALSGMALPTASATMSLSLTSGTFVGANVGNALFFASTYAPQSLSVSSVSFGGLPTTSVKIDTYMFNYYYLAPKSGPGQMGGQPYIELREWHSVPYADYAQLTSLTGVKLQNAVAVLVSSGITRAWDSGSATQAGAFYTMTAGGAFIVDGGALAVATDSKLVPKAMINVIEGAASGGFHFGVSPNTGTSFNHRFKVPQYCQAPTSTFPSGFETMVVGPAEARQVVARLVLAVQGNMKGILAYENTLFVTVRDGV